MPKHALEGHTVTTVPEMGWAGLTNGELLRRAVGRFDVFVTVDRGLSFQQNLARIDTAIVLVSSLSNRLVDLLPLVPLCLLRLSVSSLERSSALWAKHRPGDDRLGRAAAAEATE
jgi:hypothetical protein